MKTSERPPRPSLIVLVLLLSSIPALCEVVKGPYLVDMTLDSTRIRIEADVLLSTEVRVWPESDPSAVRTFIAIPETLSAQVRSVSAESPAKTLDREETHYIYDVQLLGLEPGTAYRYLVHQGGVAGGGGRFRTFEARPDRVRFIALGDVRTGHDVHRQLARRIRAQDPAFVTIPGDLAVDGKVYAEWGPFFDIEKEFFHDIPLVPAWGNHDGRGGYFERFFPFARRSYTRSLDCGPVHLVLIDSGNDEEAGELQWIDEDLAKARRAPWKIAVYHHPSFNEGGHFSAFGWKKLLPLLKRHGVDLTITGHSHLYERSFPLKSALKDEHPIVHVVSGGGGAPLAGDLDAFYLEAHSKLHHYLLVEASPVELTGTAIGLDGRPIDRFTLRKPGPVAALKGGKAPSQGPSEDGGRGAPAAGSPPPASPPPPARGPDAPPGAAGKVVAEEAVALWRGLRGAFDTRARFRIAEAKDGKPPEPLPGAVLWLFKVPPCPLPRRLPVEVRLSPAERERWSLTPETIRFDWGPEGLIRLFSLRPRTADALVRETPPRLEVRVENILVGFSQSVPLKVVFSREGKTTRRQRL